MLIESRLLTPPLFALLTTSVSYVARWEEVGEVSELVIYPLKSGRGVKVTEANATIYGLGLDLLEDRLVLRTQHTHTHV